MRRAAHHITLAKRVPIAMPNNEERDLLGGLGGVVTGIINGINSILHPGHSAANHGGHHNQAPPQNTEKGNAAPPATTTHKQQQPTQKAALAAPPADNQPSTSEQSPSTQNYNNNDAESSSPAPKATPPPSSTSTTPSSTSLQTTFVTPTQTPSSSTDTSSSAGITQTASSDIASGPGISKAGLGVLVTVLALLALVVAFFLYRRRQRQKRNDRLAASTWAQSNFPRYEEKSVAEMSGTPTVVGGAAIGAALLASTPRQSTIADERSYITAADVGHNNNNSSLSIPPVPMASFVPSGEQPHSPLAASIASRQRSAFSDFGRSPPNSPGSTHHTGIPSPLSGMPSELAPLPPVYGSDSSHSHSQDSSHQSVDAMEALVSCSFIPSLPDELNIATGERVRILEEYDDGWAKCQNARGDEGMVPLECVRRLTTVPGGAQPTWRHSERVSSISGH